MFYKQHTLTKWWNYNILYKFPIVLSDTLVSSFLDVLPLLLAVILSGLLDQKEIKIELQKKIHRKICVRDITFFDYSHYLHVKIFQTFYVFQFNVWKKLLLREMVRGWRGDWCPPCLSFSPKVFHAQ